MRTLSTALPGLVRRRLPIFALALLLVACGGGGSEATPAGTPSAVNNPPVAANPNPTPTTPATPTAPATPETPAAPTTPTTPVPETPSTGSGGGTDSPSGGSGGAGGGTPSTPDPSIPAAIAALKPGQWLELPNTKIRSVLPPSPRPRGDPAHIVVAWNGGTVDTKRNRLLVWGGGHSDYYGNEMYALDLPSMSIQRLTDPSPRNAESACLPALPDGTPTSRHTYDGLTYISHLDRFFAIHGSLAPCGGESRDAWTYDFGTRQWALLTTANPVYFFGTMAVYDPLTKLVYVKDVDDFFSYSSDTNSFAKLNRQGQKVDYHLSAAIDSKRRKFVTVGDGIRVIDLKTYEMTTMATTNTPTLVALGQSPGIGYDPVADRMVVWRGGDKVYALNMDTGAWTQVATNDGPKAEAPYQGTFGRWGYIPQYKVFALINDVDQNAWVFKLAE